MKALFNQSVRVYNENTRYLLVITHYLKMLKALLLPETASAASFIFDYCKDQCKKQG
jgi:hypothetical protein